MRELLSPYSRRLGYAAATLAVAIVAAVMPAAPAAAIILPGLDQHGAVAWGYNASGQLGDRTQTIRLSEVNVYGLSRSVAEVAAGSAHSIALKTDGTVWTWGDNTYGQLGLGTTTSWAAPQQVAGLTGVTQIAAGGNHSMALKSDGTVWAWGSNSRGMLGDGTTANRLYPVQVAGLTGVTRIAAGGTFSLALRSDGTVWSWGAGDYGQLGDGTWYARPYAAPASQVPGPVTEISAGFRHAIALLADGTVRTWGDNSHGQLGDGFAEPASARGVNVGLPNVIHVAAGWEHTVVACSRDGNYQCGWGEILGWGDNSNGELGDGTTLSRGRPQSEGYETNGVEQLVAGFNYSAARLHALDGSIIVMSWGLNSVGQLGDGTTIQRTSPVQAYGLGGATYIAAGDFHALAVKWIDLTICC